MDNREIDLYVFSGTGNTLLVARRMASEFGALGCQISLARIEAADPAAIDPKRTLGLAFPVAAQTTYPLVWAFCEALPPTDGTEAFMVDTMMGYSGGIVGPLRSLLQRKGYQPIGAKEIVMPANIGRSRPQSAKDEAKIERGLEAAAAYARDLVAGNTRWGRIPVLPDIMRAVGGGGPTWATGRWLGARWRVDADLCTHCGLCATYCPTHNIAMNDLPRFDGRCQQCMRCFGLCPTSAIGFPGISFPPYAAMTYADLARMDKGENGS